MTVPKRLLELLRQSDTIIFVGAGVSMWSGLPTWNGFIDKLAEFLDLEGLPADQVRAERQVGDLLQAASYGFAKLTKEQISRFLRGVCLYGTAQPHEIHRKIVNLGPRAFITTNYDTLLEDSLRKWHPDRFVATPVTNRNLTALGDILHARSIDFVFKPHGDISDIESIILTREQYRTMLPGGERYAALETLRMLVATRPIIYIGFGLRDPNFFYIKDLLENTFKGATRDHYAIMPRVTSEQSTFWRSNYGLHLISYTPKTKSNGEDDHSSLLELLDYVQDQSSKSSSPSPINTLEGERRGLDAQQTLGLLRYLSGVSRFPSVTEELPLEVRYDHSSRRRASRSWWHHSPIDIQRFIEISPSRVVLRGSPGAGKTYALRRAAAALATKTHDQLLIGSQDVSIPLFIDLKLYNGNFIRQLEDALPADLPLTTVLKETRVILIVDSFNELPRQFWEDNSYEGDIFPALHNLNPSRIIVASRTDDGLTKLSYEQFVIEGISRSYINEKFRIPENARFRDELEQILALPLYYGFCSRFQLSINQDTRPHDIYAKMFAELEIRFCDKFSIPLSLLEALQAIAYEAIDTGVESFPLATMLEVIELSIPNAPAADIANWLVSQNMIASHANMRVSFFHQSATEYLASREIARRFQSEPTSTLRKLRLARWDHAMFLSLHLLSPEETTRLQAALAQFDILIGARAAKYMEIGREQFVNELLERIERLEISSGSYFRVKLALEHELPMSPVHEDRLRSWLSNGGLLGEVASVRLFELCGERIKSELFKAMQKHSNDFNFNMNGLSEVLPRMATMSDISIIKDMIIKLTEHDGVDIQELSDEKLFQEAQVDNSDLPITDQDSEEENQRDDGDGYEGEVDRHGGFAHTAAAILEQLPTNDVLAALGSQSGLSGRAYQLAMNILLWTLPDTPTVEGVSALLDMLEQGIDAVYAISSLRHEEIDDLIWKIFDIKHINLLTERLVEGDTWAFSALRMICEHRGDLARSLLSWASSRTDLPGILCRYALSGESAELIDFLKTMAPRLNNRDDERWQLISHINMPWKGNEQALVDVIKTKNLYIAKDVLESLYNSIYSQHEDLGPAQLGDISWWVAWFLEMGPDLQLLDSRCVRLFEIFATDTVRQRALELFNSADAKTRHVLERAILRAWPDISTDEMSNDAISFLITELDRDRWDGWHPLFLGLVATERLIEERLLPLVASATGIRLKNLKGVLSEAGRRHGRRYPGGEWT